MSTTTVAKVQKIIDDANTGDYVYVSKRSLAALLKKIDEQSLLIAYTSREMRTLARDKDLAEERELMWKSSHDKEQQKNFLHLKRIEALEKELKG